MSMSKAQYESAIKSYQNYYSVGNVNKNMSPAEIIAELLKVVRLNEDGDYTTYYGTKGRWTVANNVKLVSDDFTDDDVAGLKAMTKDKLIQLARDYKKHYTVISNAKQATLPEVKAAAKGFIDDLQDVRAPFVLGGKPVAPVAAPKKVPAAPKAEKSPPSPPTPPEVSFYRGIFLVFNSIYKGEWRRSSRGITRKMLCESWRLLA